MRTIRDERGIVGEWLIKVLVGIAIFGVVAFDVGAILVNVFTLDSAADDVAIAVSLTVAQDLRQTFTDEEIFQEARNVVRGPEGVEGARVLRQGTGIDEEGVVTVRLRRVADTLVVSRIGAIEKWARAIAEGRSGSRP